MSLNVQRATFLVSDTLARLQQKECATTGQVGDAEIKIASDITVPCSLSVQNPFVCIGENYYDVQQNLLV
jgi:hypothetical protein